MSTKTFAVDTGIRAAPEAVWDLLTDAAGFPGWDPTYTRIDGRIGLGETITFHHRILKPKVLRMKVTAFDPPRRMVWTGGDMPEVMLKGERIFTVAPGEDGGARFRMQSVFSGVMAPLILGSIGDMQSLVEEFAAVLKRRAEQGADFAVVGRASASPALEPDPEGPSVTIVRCFAAPVNEVFAAWTDPTLLRQWLAPGPCSVVEATADARLGGRYRIVVVDPIGSRHVTSGEYREVVPGERLVQTWTYEGPNAPGPYPTLLTVGFRALGPESTEITLLQEQLLTDADREGNREGWRLCFEKLDALIRLDF